MTRARPARPAGIVLAGGLGRRMGGEKAQHLLHGRPLLDQVIARLAPQAGPLAISANGDPARFAGYGLPVLADPIPGHPGPLAGILAALDWAAGLTPGPSHVVSVPCDAPFLPLDLVLRLAAAGPGAACAASGGRLHAVVGLWPVSTRAELRRALQAAGLSRAAAWARQCGAVRVDFAIGAVDPFFNINTPQDLAEAERLIAAAG